MREEKIKVASLKPFKKATIQWLFEHDGRTDDRHSHSNKDIDTTKSYLNYDLCQKQGTVYKRFKKRLSEVKCLARDDVNVIDSLVVHLPEDVKKGDERKFFEGVYAFACNDYDEKNIVTASVHRDETREHIHIDFIPVVEKLNKKKGIMEERVSHEDKINKWGSKPKEYFNMLHIRLSEYMKNYLGYEVSILNGATANGNKTILELKSETLEMKNKNLEKQIDNLQVEKRNLKKEVEKWKKKKEENNESRSNLLESIPPLRLEEYPIKPEPPQKPKESSQFAFLYANKKEEREERRVKKKYEKEKKIYDNKILPAWQKECASIDERNSITRKEWERQYKTSENIKKAENQISMELSRVNVYKQQIQEQLRKVEVEKKKLEEERRKLEMEIKHQVECYQQDVQQGIQREIDKLFKDTPTSREERLEEFCKSFNYGESNILELFEEQEKELTKTIEKQV